jgi:hypothetical protein
MTAPDKPLDRITRVAELLDEAGHDPAQVPGLPGIVILAAAALRKALDDLVTPFDQEAQS